MTGYKTTSLHAFNNIYQYLYLHNAEAKVACVRMAPCFGVSVMACIVQYGSS